MKIKLPYLLLVAFSLVLFSCGNPAFRGFEKMKDGTYMKFYNVDDNQEKPKVGDVVLIDINQFYGDSLGFSTMNEYGKPMRYEVMEPFFVGDIMAALLNMHVNDSASVVFLVDSLCLKTYGMSEIPEYLNPGMPVYADIRLIDIISSDELENERNEELVKRKTNDVDLLTEYYADDSNKITNDGLIVLNINGKNKKTAVEGDIMLINFGLRTLEGDTLLYLYENDPVAVKCGDLALGVGFDEALKMVPETGNGSFVIPSKLAFDSVGLDETIDPYTSLLLDVEVVRIMTLKQYEDEMKHKKEIEDEEAMKRLQDEPTRIADFVKKNNIKVNPTESGLYYLEIQKGSGAVAEKGDVVSIHYNIYNIEDKLIETSYGGEPLSFVFGQGEMVPGIEEAIGYMKKGGKATIIVPSQLGFGNAAIDKDLPANSTVIFDIDFVDLRKNK